MRGTGYILFPDLVERGECECSWIGFNNSEEGNDYQTAVWGYIYSYATGIDGITFKDGFDMDTYLSGYEAIDSDIDDVNCLTVHFLQSRMME